MSRIGLEHLKTQQDALLPAEDQYVRCMIEIPDSHLRYEPDDVPDDGGRILTNKHFE